MSGIFDCGVVGVVDVAGAGGVVDVTVVFTVTVVPSSSSQLLLLLLRLGTLLVGTDAILKEYMCVVGDVVRIVCVERRINEAATKKN